MKRYWELVRGKIDEMSLRERLMIFLAAAFVLISALNALLLDPLLAEQKSKSAQVVQQLEKMKELQAQMQALIQAKQDNQQSPLHQRIAALRQQVDEQDEYLQSRRDRLVAPDKMAEVLEQVLGKHGKLQLIEMDTLAVTPLIEKAAAGAAPNQSVDEGRQIFKHGVTLTLRGSYAELTRYVTALEGLPVQMFWGDAQLQVDTYPDAELTLTLYTLSLDKTWLSL
ncbi:MAG: agglutinin biogenesis protein [Gallionella sp.]|nr:agglutinin biogenesis protein [Gallionella sp.]